MNLRELKRGINEPEAREPIMQERDTEAGAAAPRYALRLRGNAADAAKPDDRRHFKYADPWWTFALLLAGTLVMVLTVK
jgi:hypothetical protein